MVKNELRHLRPLLDVVMFFLNININIVLEYRRKKCNVVDILDNRGMSVLFFKICSRDVAEQWFKNRSLWN